MNPEADPAEAARLGEEPGPSDGPLFSGWPEHLWFAWATVVLPAACFGLALLDLTRPEWKRPTLGLWPQLLLSREPTLAFLPLAGAVAALCLALALRPGAWARTLPVRLGLGSGLVLAVQYAVLVFSGLLLDDAESWSAVGTVAFVLAAAVAVTVGVPRLLRGPLRRLYLRWARRRWGRRRLWTAVGALLLLVWLAGANQLWGRSWDPELTLLRALGRVPLHALGWALFLSLAAAPVWCGLALLRLLLRLGSVDGGRPRLGRRTALGGLSLLAAYGVSWRLAYLEALETYHRLPDSPQDCFVATAAARAPAWLTGGGPAPRQLRRLKAFELLLLALAPRLHRLLRRPYDRWGPPLAATLRTPARSALAFLLLKPLELLALALVRAAGGPAAARKLGPPKVRRRERSSCLPS